MPVILRHRGELKRLPKFRYWFCTEDINISNTDIFVGADPLPNIPRRLEESFESVMAEWWDLGKSLGRTPTGRWSHTTACSPNASELGSCLAWTRIVEECATHLDVTLVVCGDPWLYRHLSGLQGVKAGSAPCLWWAELRSSIRGSVSRLLNALRLAVTASIVRRHRRHYPKGMPALLVYGHPQSRPHGPDAYFGDLMAHMPQLVRIMHVDAALSIVRKFSSDPRTFSLHAWGPPMGALAMVLTKWHPCVANVRGKNAWLVRRQAAVEGANAQALLIRWQEECQRAWLADAKPSIVAWPWENLHWERRFVTDAKLCGIRTIGYQHATIGRHAANQSLASNIQGEKELPDLILCNGKAGATQLIRWGIPNGRIKTAGAFRIPKISPIDWDPKGPVLVTLPMKHAVAREMIEALESISASDLKFVVKVHPMTVMQFNETPNIKRTTSSLSDFQYLRAVIFAASTTGLEALFMGLPALRFMPRATVAIDILSPPAVAINVTAETLEFEIRNAFPGEPLAKENFFAPIDYALWQKSLC